MATSEELDNPAESTSAVRTAGRQAIYPQTFSISAQPGPAGAYLSDPAIRKLAEFFEAKGLTALKDEDRAEQWYDDWLAYQAAHGLYAAVLSPEQFSTVGARFDLLRYVRFLEVFAYFSPAHGYSLQVTFLGFFAILMGSNTALKREAVAALEAGKLLAFGVSERSHGSDLLANEFTITETHPGRFLANGTKYYIGNSNAAAIIAILARKGDPRFDGRLGRAPFALLALRPGQSQGFRDVRKIRTLGVRAAYVGEFEVKDHPLPESDLIAQGRQAWDAVFGTVTLGKFFLGFGSIGICEHAFQEAAAHLSRRVLYGKPVIEMPHIRSAMARAYARLTAMKLYAYRALDYIHAARAEDRRYLLYCAVQKAKVSTEGVKVMALMSECVGAKGFEADTYFEMALRDAQLIPGLEGSAHINLGFAAQLIPRYFGRPDPNLAEPASLLSGEIASEENLYLMEARTGGVNTITFGPFLKPYRPILSVPNVRLFTRQARDFRIFARRHLQTLTGTADTQVLMLAGGCLATIAYAQLVAENAVRLAIPQPMISAIFDLLVGDLSALALMLASVSHLNAASRVPLRQMITVPESSSDDWDFVSQRSAGRRPA